ncbi:hypothetical protein GCM10023196_099880 [Actinoallomurus vinaceus]|uniref:Uncharacterized protein n=1 Tax=Actinoallomurus vinaceus TaxID=1080074 RepID=A0ABP8USZ8_9ACTN
MGCTTVGSVGTAGITDRFLSEEMSAGLEKVRPWHRMPLSPASRGGRLSAPAQPAIVADDGAPSEQLPDPRRLLWEMADPVAVGDAPAVGGDFSGQDAEQGAPVQPRDQQELACRSPIGPFAPGWQAQQGGLGGSVLTDDPCQCPARRAAGWQGVSEPSA